MRPFRYLAADGGVHELVDATGAPVATNGLDYWGRDGVMFYVDRPADMCSTDGLVPVVRLVRGKTRRRVAPGDLVEGWAWKPVIRASVNL